jgi:protein TonB
MPQEFLRDVLRTGDAAGPARRHWSTLPLSIAAHVCVAAAIVIIPLAAEVELPVPASPFTNRWIPIVAEQLPAIARPVPRIAQPSTTAAPTSAPSKIEPEVEHPPETISPPGALDGPPGLPVTSGLATGVDGLAIPPPAAPPDPPPAVRAPIRIGGKIRPPERIAGGPPVYPPIAINARVEGDVVLDALIDEHGNVVRVRVLKSFPLLDAAAVEAVRGWRYTPTLLNGVPMPVLMTVTVRFSLQR